VTSTDDTFLGRWSRRKQTARSAGPSPDAAATDTTGEPAASPGPTPPSAGPGASDRTTEAATPDAALPSAEERFKDFDFDTLDASSDYKPFMATDVPDHIRTKALARLWVSNPILAAPDPFSDCVGDFTDAARAVPGGLLRTAYKVGQGFLSDEEAAVWDRLGRPQKAPEAEAGRDNAAPAASVEPEVEPDLPPIAKAIAAVHAGSVAVGAPADGTAPASTELPATTPSA